MKDNMSLKSNKGRFVEKAIAIAVALLLWQILSMCINQGIILASPISTLKALCGLISTKEFYVTIGYTIGKILLGFLLGLIAGTILAALSGSFRVIEILMYPYISVMKSTPVASFVILALIFIGTSRLSIFISFVIVVPVIYTNILKGIKSLDKGMTEMAEVFGIDGAKRGFLIYLPQLSGYVEAAIVLSVGMAFKAGVAAEVIGTPNHSIGKMLYEAKIYLETPELFAWTVAIIVLSIIAEKLIVNLIKLIFRVITKHMMFGGLVR